MLISLILIVPDSPYLCLTSNTANIKKKQTNINGTYNLCPMHITYCIQVHA